MKYLLPLIVLIVIDFGQTYAQSGVGYIELRNTDSTRDVIGVSFNEKDSSLDIIGDTLEVLKFLFWRARERDKHEMELWETVEAGVKYANSIPDYYKSGKGGKCWTEYLSLLMRCGYVKGKPSQNLKCK